VISDCHRRPSPAPWQVADRLAPRLAVLALRRNGRLAAHPALFFMTSQFPTTCSAAGIGGQPAIRVQPRQQQRRPGGRFAALMAQAPAMAADGWNWCSSRRLRAAQGGGHQRAVLGRGNRVVERLREEDGRRARLPAVPPTARRAPPARDGRPAAPSSHASCRTALHGQHGIQQHGKIGRAETRSAASTGA
jgi:hypothetical protein